MGVSATGLPLSSIWTRSPKIDSYLRASTEPILFSLIKMRLKLGYCCRIFRSISCKLRLYRNYLLLLSSSTSSLGSSGKLSSDVNRHVSIEKYSIFLHFSISYLISVVITDIGISSSMREVVRYGPPASRILYWTHPSNVYGTNILYITNIGMQRKTKTISERGVEEEEDKQNNSG